MDKAEKINAEKVNAILRKNYTEMWIMRLTSDPEANPLSKLKFSTEPSGLVVISREEFSRVVASHKALIAKVTEANKLKEVLQKELEEAKAAKIAGFTSDEQFSTFLDLRRDRRRISDQLSKAKDETDGYRKTISNLQYELKDTQHKLKSLSGEHERLKNIFSVYKEIKETFTKKMAEVYQAQVELREPRLRPKAPKGCLNCGKVGHSFSSCPKEYSGLFCQKCAHPDFPTEYCPWPHFERGLPQVPEHLRCKICRRPRNLPDANCNECRKRMIRDGIVKRNELAQKLEDESASMQSHCRRAETGSLKPDYRKDGKQLENQTRKDLR